MLASILFTLYHQVITFPWIFYFWKSTNFCHRFQFFSQRLLSLIKIVVFKIYVTTIYSLGIKLAPTHLLIPEKWNTSIPTPLLVFLLILSDVSGLINSWFPEIIRL